MEMDVKTDPSIFVTVHTQASGVHSTCNVLQNRKGRQENTLARYMMGLIVKGHQNRTGGEEQVNISRTEEVLFEKDTEMEKPESKEHRQRHPVLSF